MINFIQLKEYCQGDYTQIENYEKALNDKENMWACHHRRETDENKSMKQLKDANLYYYIPPEELIFLTKRERMRIHNLGERNPMYGKNCEDFMTEEAIKEKRRKMSEANKDKKLSEEQKKAISIRNSGENNGMYGKGYLVSGENNGMYGKQHSKERKQQISETFKDLNWYNNGIIRIRAKECPEGFVRGMKLKT